MVPLDRGWVGPTASLHIVEKRKYLAFVRNQTLIPQPSNPQPIVILTELAQLPKWNILKLKSETQNSKNLRYDLRLIGANMKTAASQLETGCQL
jgi:hypothetical protein